MSVFFVTIHGLVYASLNQHEDIMSSYQEYYVFYYNFIMDKFKFGRVLVNLNLVGRINSDVLIAIVNPILRCKSYIDME